MRNAQLEELSKAAATALRKDGFASDREQTLAKGVVELLAERDILLQGVQYAYQRLHGTLRIDDESVIAYWKNALDVATPGWR